MTCGEVFENLEYDEEEIKELTESFTDDDYIHILKQIIKDESKRPRESFD